MELKIDKKTFIGFSILLFGFLLLQIIMPVLADIGGGQGPFSDPQGQLTPASANLTRGDMFFADGNTVFVVANFSCSGTSVCNSSTSAVANFSQLGGSGSVAGVYKNHSSGANWVLFEFNDTVNYTAIASPLLNMGPATIFVNATDGNATDTLDVFLNTTVVLANMSYPPGCPDANEQVQLPPQIPLKNGTLVSIDGCYQCSTGYHDNARWNGTHWEICGPTFGGYTTNFTEVASTGNFSNFHLVLDVPGRGRINFTNNVSFTSQGEAQAIMEFAVKGIMSGGRIGMNETEWNGTGDRPDLNVSAQLTIYNVSQGFNITGVPQIFRYEHNAVSGSSCPMGVCSDFTWDGENITFSVNSWSDYGLSDAINVTLSAPTNNGYSDTRNINFTYTPEWDTSLAMDNCTLYGNFTGTWESTNQTNQTLLVNNVLNGINNTVASDSAYIWNVYCYDNTSQYDLAASNWTVLVDTVLPMWFNNTTSVSSPTTYSSGQSYQFNVTWTELNKDTIYIEHNLTGSTTPHNDTFTGNNGDEYYFDVSGLAAGTYVWRSFVNDSAGNANVTDQWFYTVNKGVATVTITGVSNGTYPVSETIYFGINDTDGLSGTIYYNGTSFTNNTDPDLSVGLWNITAYTSGNENYTSDSATVWNDISKADPSSGMTLTLDDDSTSSQTRTYPNATDVQSSESNSGDGSCEYTFVQNGTIISSGAKTLAARAYNFTYNTTGCENYTSATKEIILTVNKGATSITITGISNGTYPVSQTIYFGINDTDGLSGTIYYNGTSFTNNTDPDLSVGLWEVKANISGNENYTSSSETVWNEITQGDNPVSLYLNGTLNSNKTITYPENANATGVAVNSNSGTVYLFRDGVQVDSGTDIANETILLGNGTYVYKLNMTGNENYTSNSTGLTYYLVVNKADPSSGMTLTLDDDSTSSQTRTYPNATNIQSSESNSGDGSCEYTLVENGTVISNGAKTLAARAYNFTYNTTGCENYTSANKEVILTLNKAETGVTITGVTNGTYPIAQTIYFRINDTIGLTGNIYYNGTSFTNNTDPVLPAGLWEVKANTSGNENYTSGSTIVWNEITKGTSSISLFIRGAEASITIGNNTGANITVVNNISSTTVYMTTNRTGWSQSSGTTPYENTSELIYGPEYGSKINVTGWWNGNENYTSDSQTYYVTVEQRSPLWNDTSGYLGSNTSSPELGDGVLLYGMGYDFTALDWAWLATNESSDWENKTANYSSPTNMSDTGAATWGWSNFTWSNSSVSRGTIVGWRVYYNNTAGKENVTNIQTFTVATTTTTTTSTTTTTASSGGGGGGSSDTPKKHERKMIFNKVTPGAASIMKITDPEIGLKQIIITVKNQANNVRITVTKLDGKPASVTHEVSGKVYKYIEIGTSNLDDENLEDADIEFEVNKTWLLNNSYDPETVKLNRYLNGWQELETEMTDQDDDYYYYKSLTPGFSYFVITAEEESEDVDQGPVCGNSVCEEGEDYESCSTDCQKPSEKPKCGNDVCETGEACGNCLADCPCAEGYECQENVCKTLSTGTKKKFPLRTVTILVLIFVTLGVIGWLVYSLKEEQFKKHKKKPKKPKILTDENLGDWKNKTEE